MANLDRKREGNTELQLWAEVDPLQKSYVVQVLHWFYYRPQRIKASWRQEETLTWELIRALDVLPHKLFLCHLLERLKAADIRNENAVDGLLKHGNLEVFAYPKLGMPGSKRNCASDIGIGTEGRPLLWLEAKTARFRPADLEAQLRQQSVAMEKLMPGQQTVLVTLLPKSRALESFPNLDWLDVEAGLDHCIRELTQAIPDCSLARGYLLIASELLGRIRSHPNRISGWV